MSAGPIETEIEPRNRSLQVLRVAVQLLQRDDVETIHPCTNSANLLCLQTQPVAHRPQHGVGIPGDESEAPLAAQPAQEVQRRSRRAPGLPKGSTLLPGGSNESALLLRQQVRIADYLLHLIHREDALGRPLAMSL